MQVFESIDGWRTSLLPLHLLKFTFEVYRRRYAFLVVIVGVEVIDPLFRSIVVTFFGRLSSEFLLRRHAMQ